MIIPLSLSIQTRMDDNYISYFTSKILAPVARADFYIGTFTSDRVLTDIKINFNKPFFVGFIVNTLSSRDDDDSQIGHWIGVTVQHDKRKNILILKYLDSYGRKYINKYIKIFFEKIKKMSIKNNISFIIDYIEKPIQKKTSKVCGLYSVYFIINSWLTGNRKSVKELFRGFSLKNGDIKMIHFLFKNYPNLSCHSTKVFGNYKMSILELLNSKVPPPFCPQRTLDASRCFNKCRCGFIIRE